MKKLLCGLVVGLSLVVSVFAAGYGDWKWNAGDLDGAAAIQSRLDTLVDRAGGSNYQDSTKSYSIVVSSNITGQVYCWQTFAITANVSVTTTQALPVTYIATPQAFYQYTAGAGVYIPTNVITVATNSLTVLLSTNASLFVYGRIK